MSAQHGLTHSSAGDWDEFKGDLRGSTSGMKRKNKRKMVGVVNNTLDVSEETRNEEKKKAEKCGNRD